MLAEAERAAAILCARRGEKIIAVLKAWWLPARGNNPSAVYGAISARRKRPYISVSRARAGEAGKLAMAPKARRISQQYSN